MPPPISPRGPVLVYTPWARRPPYGDHPSPAFAWKRALLIIKQPHERHGTCTSLAVHVSGNWDAGAPGKSDAHSAQTETSDAIDEPSLCPWKERPQRSRKVFVTASQRPRLLLPSCCTSFSRIEIEIERLVQLYYNGQPPRHRHAEHDLLTIAYGQNATQLGCANSVFWIL